MSRTMTENRVQVDFEFESTASGSWENRSASHLWRAPTQRFVQTAGAAICLSISPITAIADPWPIHDTVLSTNQPVENPSRRRQISIKEAIRIADDIMRKAESERRATAEEEAVHIMNLEVDL